eukprot:6208114-Pleurochrysis_carterae.AAC.1
MIAMSNMLLPVLAMTQSQPPGALTVLGGAIERAGARKSPSTWTQCASSGCWIRMPQGKCLQDPLLSPARLHVMIASSRGVSEFVGTFARLGHRDADDVAVPSAGQPGSTSSPDVYGVLHFVGGAALGARRTHATLSHACTRCLSHSARA